MNIDQLTGTLAGKVLAGQRAQRSMQSDELLRASEALFRTAETLGAVELIAASPGASELIGAVKAIHPDLASNLTVGSQKLVVESVAVTGHNIKSTIGDLSQSNYPVVGVWVWQSAVDPAALQLICGSTTVIQENTLCGLG